MKNKILYKLQLLVLTGAVLFGFFLSAGAQSGDTAIVSGTLVDENGDPLAGVSISNPVGETVVSDADGNFEILADEDLSLLFEKENYNSRLLPIAGIQGQVTLEKSDILASEKDLLNMGISKKYRREMTGAASTISPKDQLTYDHTQYVRDYVEGILLGVNGWSDIRGLGGALFVIDGVVGRDPDILNMDEIDRITVLKDANAIALYGNQAANGVIIINTKRGQINKKTANVNLRYGIRQPLALPRYLGSADYMELYNEARANDGMGEAFDPETIEMYRSGSNPIRYPDVDYFSDGYLRPYNSRADVITEFASGNEKSQYYVNMGWNFNQSLLALNPDVNVGSSRFNIRGNIDFKVNDFIRSSVDAVAIVSNNKSALIDWFYSGTTMKPHTHAPLLPISMMVDTSAAGTLQSQIDAANQFDGMLLGTSQAYPGDTLIANTLAGGYLKSNFRSTQFNNSIDIDLDMITEGLSARTYLSFDFYDGYELSIENKYQLYQPNWAGDSIVGLTPYGNVDRRDLTERVSTTGYVSRLGFYGLLNYQKRLKERHGLNATLIGYINYHQETSIIQADKNSHIGLQVTYDLDKKLFVDFSSAIVHSIKLPEGNRNGFSPTLGIAYILSEDDFIRNLGFVNFLKVKATAGIIKSDIGIDEYYLYEENYTEGSWFGWADGTYTTRTRDISQAANYDMTFEDRIDLNLGFESYLLNSLWVEFNYFNIHKANQITKLESEYPSFYSPFNPYNNYNNDSYNGFELGMNYLKKMDDFSIMAGLNMVYAKSNVVKRSEVYNYDYQYRVGNPVDAYFGLVDDGFYTDADFSTGTSGNLVLNEDLPVPAFGAVQPGDLKYIDQNDDGVIDINDQIYIGQWRHPWSFGMNIKLTYKRLSLYVLGLAQAGGENLRNNNYYWVDGNDKYSEVALNRWTPETASTATYPRLSAGNNTHNFQTSTFWLYDNSYFDVKRAQLTYELSERICKKLKMKALSINVAGVNLLRIAENKDYQLLNIGSGPQYRYLTVGLRSSF